MVAYVCATTTGICSIEMNCDYYVDSYLVIEYLANNGAYCKLTTDLSRQQKYIRIKDANDSYATEADCYYTRKLEQKIEKHTYRQMIYSKNDWSSSMYKCKYADRIRNEFQFVYKLQKMYKEFTAFKADEY